MIAQVVVDIGDQNVEGDAPMERMGVCLSLRAVMGECIDDLRIVSRVAILGVHHRHDGQKRDACRALAIEASRQQHRLSGDFDELVLRGRDPGLVGQAQRDLLPCFHTVVVSFFRELCDGQMAMVIDYRRLWSCTAERRAGRKDELKIFLCFLVPKDPLSDLKEAAEFYEGRTPALMGVSKISSPILRNRSVRSLV